MITKRISEQGKVYAPLAELKQNDKNPRSHTEEDLQRLVRQIARLGQYKPVIVDPEGMVIGGNKRLLALDFVNSHIVTIVEANGKERQIDRRNQFSEIWISELAIGEIEIENPPDGMQIGGTRYFAILDGKQETELFDSAEQVVIEYLMSDNDSIGSWDRKALKLLIQPHKDLIPAKNYKLNLSPATSLRSFMGIKDEVKEDEPPAVDNENPAVSQVGEVYQLGRHKLMCGDSTNKEDVLRLMKGQRVELVLTDPPYGVDFKRGQFISDDKRAKNDAPDSIVGDHRKTEDQKEFIKTTFLNIKEIAKEGVSVYMFSAPLQEGCYSMLGLLEAGVHVQSQLIWVKNNHVLGQADYQWKHEICWYGYFPNGSHKWYGGRDRFTIIDDLRLSRTYHPNEKPLNLLMRLLSNSSVNDDNVIDPFGGSGSTLIACEQLNRTCYMMELDPKYCDVIRKRYAKFIGQEDWQAVTPAI